MYEPYKVGITIICAMKKMDESSQLQLSFCVLCWVILIDPIFFPEKLKCMASYMDGAAVYT